MQIKRSAQWIKMQYPDRSDNKQGGHAHVYTSFSISQAIDKFIKNIDHCLK